MSGGFHATSENDGHRMKLVPVLEVRWGKNGLADTEMWVFGFGPDESTTCLYQIMDED